jgi:hypothetical protein
VKRALLLALIAVLGAPAAAGAAASSKASARLLACAPSLDPAARYLVARGEMEVLRRSARLQMRFDLEVRTPRSPRWSPVKAPGFGVWNTAAPGRRRYLYDKRVQNLAAPAVYRMVVRFRWRDAAGRRLAKARRTTKPCRQPDLRPDLLPLDLAPAPGPEPGTRRYVVPVLNDGASAAGPFAVTLWVDGRVQPSRSVVGLAPGGRTELQLVAPECAPGSTLTVRVDAEGAVDERDEDDNELSRACPANPLEAGLRAGARMGTS